MNRKIVKLQQSKCTLKKILLFSLPYFSSEGLNSQKSSLFALQKKLFRNRVTIIYTHVGFQPFSSLVFKDKQGIQQQ